MRLIILGAGGYGQTVADIARQSGKYESVSFLDDDSTRNNTIGICADYIKFAGISEIEIYPALGNNECRLSWIHKLKEAGAALPKLIHLTAYTSPTATIGEGTVVLPKAVINTNCKVGNGCIINCGAIVDHGCVIEDGVHICLGAIIKGENHISRCMKIEAGEVIQFGTYPV